MPLEKVVENIVNDSAVALTQEFDRNFERKAFFDRKWASTRLINKRGSIMARSGKLRRSVNKSVSGTSISWNSSLPYASIHNEGGEIEVTAKMKKFFWAMYYKSSGGITKTKKGETRNNVRNTSLTIEAKQWKSLALQPVGTIMNIEQRQFVGWHPKVDITIRKIATFNIQEVNNKIANKLK